MHDLIKQLDRVRSRARLLLVARAVVMLVVCMAGWVVAEVVLDLLLRLPDLFRFVLLLLGCGLLGLGIWHWLFPALRFHPSLTRLALRAEGVMPELEAQLASAIEFEQSGLAERNVLAKASVQQVQEQLSGRALVGVLRVAPALNAIVASLLVVAALSVFSLMNPTVSSIGCARVFLPFGSAVWPATTVVVTEMSSSHVHPSGVPLVLSARLLKGDPERVRVHCHFVIEDHGVVVRDETVLLSRQHDNQFARIVDVAGDSIQIEFSTFDANTEPLKLTIIEPPAIESARLQIDPPDYAKNAVQQIVLDLGNGQDRRSTPEAAFLAGSTAVYQFQLNKPLPVLDPTDKDWLRATFGELAESANFEAMDPKNWRLERVLDTTMTATVSLQDEYGIENIENIAFGLQVIPDAAPAAAILKPLSDEAVLATAKVELEGEARDDIGITRAHLEINRSRAEQSPSPQPERIAEVDAVAGARVVRMTYVLDLDSINAQPGDVIEVVAVGADGFISGGEQHEEARSRVRRLVVIEETEFRSLIRSQLSSIRSAAMRMEETQRALQERLSAATAVDPDEQVKMSERVASATEAIESMQDRLERNQLADGMLSALLEQSRDILQAAGQASEKAAGELATAQESEKSGESTEKSEQANNNALDAQQDVREELEDLVALLDQDEDAWVVTRRVESMLEELESLREETSDLSSSTIGSARGDLTNDERSELDRIADRQKDFAERSEELGDELRDRSDLMAENNAQRAEALNRAAQRADRSQLAQSMEEAAQAARENRLAQVQEQQGEAIETLEAMLDDLAEDRRAQVEQLARQLASLVESIEHLVHVNENELIALAQVDGVTDIADRTKSIIKLLNNTESVAADARAAGPEVQRIARQIDGAAESQGRSVGALRRVEPSIQEGAFELNESVVALRKALELARAAEEQAQEELAEEQREELSKLYRALAEREAGIRIASAPLLKPTGTPLSRREQVKSRRLALEQQAIRIDAQAIRDDHPELSETILFDHVHRMIDGWAIEVQAGLDTGNVDDRLLELEDFVLEALVSLALALEEANPDENPFEENQQGDGGGGSGGGGGPQDDLVPPLAELKLLRTMQEQINRRTRSLAERMAETPNISALDGRLLELGGMQEELFDMGTRLLELLQEQQGGGQN